MKNHDEELTLADYERLARQTEEMNIPFVTIGGGEPLLRGDVWDIVQTFKQAGRHVQLTTNGLLLGPSQRQDMYKSGLDRVTISLDSHIPQIYQRIRGIDGARIALDHLHALLLERPNHLEVDTNTVLCTENMHSFLSTLDHLVDTKVSRVNFSAITTFGGNYLMTESKVNLAQISQETIRDIVRGLLIRKKKNKAIVASSTFIRGLERYYSHPNKVVYPCLAGYLTLDVFHDGSVHGCGNLPSFANVGEASLHDIWFSAQASQNRMRMARSRCPNCYLSCKMELAIGANLRYLPRFAWERLRFHLR